MTDSERITRVEQQIQGLRQRNKQIFEILQQQQKPKEEPAKRPSFEDHFGLKRR